MIEQGWFIGIGSNIMPNANVPLIVASLLQYSSHLYCSPAIQTPPVGMHSHNSFINLVVYLETPLQKPDLTHQLKTIEARMGRPLDIENRKLIDRTADLDPLCYIATPTAPNSQLIIPNETYLNGPFLELAVYLQLLSAQTPIPAFERITLANGLFGQKPTTIYRDGTPRHKRIIE